MFSFRLSAIFRERIMVSSSRALDSLYFSMSVSLAFRNTLLVSVLSLERAPAFFMRSSTSAPVSDTMPMSCPGWASTATMSPISSGMRWLLR